MGTPPTPSELTARSPQSGDKPDRQTSHTISAEFYRGPIPHPETLQKYDDITPGLANRIVQMAESEAIHRREIETKIVDANCADMTAYHAEVFRGQICGLIIAVTALISGAYVAVQGYQWGGALLGTGGIGSIVLTFVLGRNAKPGTNEEATNSNVTKTKRRPKK
jgi:uncharacterized membrane protein